MTMDASATPQSPTRDRRAWSMVVVLWGMSVALFAVILYLLAAFQAERIEAFNLQQLVAALREGNAEQVGAIQANITYFYYPTSVLAQFAALGLAVIVTAWLGRRAVAVALPFVVVLASLAPAYWGEGTLSPQPLGQGDMNLWGTLVAEPAQLSYAGLPIWPLLLGSFVQVTLLVVPLVPAPSRLAPLPAMDVMARALVPSALVALLALAFVPPPSAPELYRAPLIAVALALLVTALATGVGPLLVRIVAAIAVPTVIAPIALSSSLDNPAHGWLLAAVAAAGSVLVLVTTLGISWAKERFASRAQALPLAEAAR